MKKLLISPVFTGFGKSRTFGVQNSGINLITPIDFELRSPMERGYVQVYTGNGKGKTTAALGLALRAVGHGLKVLIIQFMKGNTNYGEMESSRKLAPNLLIRRMGQKTFISKGHADPIDIERAREGFALAQKAIEEKTCDVLILDEINLAVDYGLIPLDDLIRLIDSKPRIHGTHPHRKKCKTGDPRKSRSCNRDGGAKALLRQRCSSPQGNRGIAGSKEFGVRSRPRTHYDELLVSQRGSGYVERRGAQTTGRTEKEVDGGFVQNSL